VCECVCVCVCVCVCLFDIRIYMPDMYMYISYKSDVYICIHRIYMHDSFI